MTLIEKLKKALKEKGLNEGLADIVKIENESEIEGIVSSLASTQTPPQELDFTEVIASEDFSKFFEKHGFDGLLKLNTKLQSEHDKRVTKGIQTRLEKFLKTKGKGGNENEEDNDDEMEEDEKAPAWAKALMEKVDGLEKQQTTKSKQQKAREALEKSKLPKKFQEKWLSRIDLENEDFEAQANTLVEEYEDFQKDVIGSTAGRGLPTGGKVDGKPSDDEVKEVLSQMN
ncbi:hypothetical protein [Joostella sp.]|uniref:hypothetical protein n=1 Tax=Joostella sp. TaxID=2231138 RepID=UPI003A8CB5F8